MVAKPKKFRETINHVAREASVAAHQARESSLRARRAEAEARLVTNSSLNADLLSKTAQRGVAMGRRMAVSGVDGLVAQFMAPGSVEPLRLPTTGTAGKTVLYHSLQTVKLTTSNVVGSQGNFAALVRATVGAGTNGLSGIARGTSQARVLATTSSTDFARADWSQLTDYDVEDAVLADRNFWRVQSNGKSIFRYYVASTGMSTALPLGPTPAVANENGVTVPDTIYNGVTGSFAIPAGTVAHFSLIKNAGNAAQLNGAAIDNFAFWKDSAAMIPATATVDYGNTEADVNHSISADDFGVHMMVRSINDIYVTFTPVLMQALGPLHCLLSICSPDDSDRVDGTFSGIRPIAMTVHAACVASEATNGGDIAAYFAPRGTNNFDAPNTLDSLANFDKLSGHNEEVYSGPLSEGAYVIWTPEDNSDLEFRSVQDHLDVKFPEVIVAGVATPGIVGAGNQHVVTLYIHRIFEMTTEVGLFQQEPSDLMQSDLDLALYTFRVTGMRHAMANGRHVSFIRRFVSSVSKYARDPNGLRRDIQTAGQVVQELKRTAAMVL